MMQSFSLLSNARYFSFIFSRELQFNNLSIIRKNDFKAFRQLRIL